MLIVIPRRCLLVLQVFRSRTEGLPEEAGSEVLVREQLQTATEQEVSE